MELLRDNGRQGAQALAKAYKKQVEDIVMMNKKEKQK